LRGQDATADMTEGSFKEGNGDCDGNDGRIGQGDEMKSKSNALNPLSRQRQECIPDPPLQDEGFWICAQCTMKNLEATVSCEMCNFRRPRRRQKPNTLVHAQSSSETLKKRKRPGASEAIEENSSTISEGRSSKAHPSLVIKAKLRRTIEKKESSRNPNATSSNQQAGIESENGGCDHRRRRVTRKKPGNMRTQDNERFPEVKRKGRGRKLRELKKPELRMEDTVEEGDVVSNEKLLEQLGEDSSSDSGDDKSTEAADDSTRITNKRFEPEDQSTDSDQNLQEFIEEQNEDENEHRDGDQHLGEALRGRPRKDRSDKTEAKPVAIPRKKPKDMTGSSEAEIHRELESLKGWWRIEYKSGYRAFYHIDPRGTVQLRDIWGRDNGVHSWGPEAVIKFQPNSQNLMITPKNEDIESREDLRVIRTMDGNISHLHIRHRKDEAYSVDGKGIRVLPEEVPSPEEAVTVPPGREAEKWQRNTGQDFNIQQHQQQHQQSQSRHEDQKVSWSERPRVMVSRIDSAAPIDEVKLALKDHFSRYGTVTDVYIKKKEFGLTFALVYFDDEESAQMSLKQPEMQIMGRRCPVKASTRRNRNSSSNLEYRPRPIGPPGRVIQVCNEQHLKTQKYPFGDMLHITGFGEKHNEEDLAELFRKVWATHIYVQWIFPEGQSSPKVAWIRLKPREAAWKAYKTLQNELLFGGSVTIRIRPPVNTPCNARYTDGKHYPARIIDARRSPCLLRVQYKVEFEGNEFQGEYYCVDHTDIRAVQISERHFSSSPRFQYPSSNSSPRFNDSPHFITPKICFSFRDGKTCRRGAQCPYSHDPTVVNR